MSSEIMAGILSICDIQIMLLIFAGVFMGIIIGAIPGLSVTMGVALFLPLTFGMEPVAALSLLVGLYIGGTSGGLISAILLRIPGTTASIATTFDGHPMAEKGEAAKALGVGIVFSFLGGLVSYIILMLLAPAIAKVALQFGPYEYFSIGVFSMTMIASLASGSLVKGMISAMLGVVLSFVGIAPITSFTRFTFGNSELNAGFNLLPVLIGLFAVSQVLSAVEEKFKPDDTTVQSCKIKGFGFTKQDIKGQGFNFWLSTLIGTGIGILPGLGAGICNIIAYSAVKNHSKYPEKFGTGIVDGIVASETSNNASTGGALVPLLTLGLPGDNTTALILAGFMIHGITPGPLLFRSEGKLVYGIFAALIVANIMMLIVEFLGIRIFTKILTVPKNILLPIVILFCVVGAFGTNNRIFDVFVMMVFGLLGYGMKKLDFPQAPIILGFILGPIIETNLRRGLMKSQGSFFPFLTSPISCVFLVIAVVTLILTIKKEIVKLKSEQAGA
ncbi:tripartite tricarboxylate transporter permease [Clostridium sp. AM58-1XD]|uniref:tripartite tricarboxylate transporter permease n=1 Tax=Clostridium sp. AM58-1XD TaxID=2292307 RepID=UPI000E51B5D0|nr:tripartite tricarboxylate transporter permease [Clostridium sp. AM58-1XD]RGZ00370.1 Tat pathway signal protein [Clostridium sp. AM58-1XD]